MTGADAAYTTKGLLLVALPQPPLVTVIIPELLPAGNVPVITVLVIFRLVMDVDPIMTEVAPDRLVPLIVIVLPGQPEPVTLVMVGAAV